MRPIQAGAVALNPAEPGEIGDRSRGGQLRMMSHQPFDHLAVLGAQLAQQPLPLGGVSGFNFMATATNDGAVRKSKMAGSPLPVASHEIGIVSYPATAARWVRLP